MDTEPGGIIQEPTPAATAPSRRGGGDFGPRRQNPPAVIQERPPMDTEPGGIIQEADAPQPMAEGAGTSAPTPEGEALHF